MQTPALLLDLNRLERNVERMRMRLRALGTGLRLHVKTAKSADVARVVYGNTSGPIAVSTLREAEYFAGKGYTDILYAVGISPDKFDRIATLNRPAPRVTLLLDSLAAADSVSTFATREDVRLPAAIEIDSDGHRCGLAPDDPNVVRIGQRLNAAGLLRGVLTHAGGSYDEQGIDGIRRVAEQERLAVTSVAAELERAGLHCELVSVGSTPTATFGESFAGVTEVRVGVYVFQDLVMVGLGVCGLDDIALSVLTTVIGLQPARNQVIVDAGWMALSRDRGTEHHAVDQGYGVVADASGRIIDDLIVTSANQEHGIVTSRSGRAIEFSELEIGTKLRILPIHACATASQHRSYQVLDSGGVRVAEWERIDGW